MTVTVTLRDGDTDEYMRYDDTYTKHDDGTLDVVRDGAEQSYSYAPGVWTNVQGDEKQLKVRGFRGLFKRAATVAPRT
jgi:hypothetical protein